jgi:hypothetical protein
VRVGFGPTSDPTLLQVTDCTLPGFPVPPSLPSCIAHHCPPPDDGRQRVSLTSEVGAISTQEPGVHVEHLPALHAWARTGPTCRHWPEPHQQLRAVKSRIKELRVHSAGDRFRDAVARHYFLSTQADLDNIANVLQHICDISACVESVQACGGTRYAPSRLLSGDREECVGLRFKITRRPDH